MRTASFTILNVKDFGAIGDKKVKDSGAIQKAIDAAHEAGGGTVYVPPGDYIAGAISLRNNVVLYLEAGATIYASERREDYPEGRVGLIMGEGIHDVAIFGRGKLNGQGYTAFKTIEDVPRFRPLLVLFVGCKNVQMEGITLEYASSWSIHLLRCDSVNIKGINIYNNLDRFNTDGIDPDCSKNIHISDCHIIAGDDCIVLKSTQPYSCENITVTNCTLETTCSALKLGTESHGDFRHIVFSNCVIRNTKTPISFYMKDGATMEDIVFSGITIETESHKDRMPSRGPGEYPILMNIERRHPHSKLGRIQNVILRDLVIESAGRCFIEGSKEQPIENLTIENVIFIVRRYEDTSMIVRKPRGGSGSPETLVTTYDRIPAYFVLANVRGLVLRNLQLHLRSESLEKRFALFCDNLENAEIDGCNATTLGQDPPPIKLSKCRNIRIRNCSLPNILDQNE
jgi:hypothetical protein